MRLLLDTQVLLWWLPDDPALSPAVRATINTEPEVFVSAASVWEVGIKVALGKLETPGHLGEQVDAEGFRRLPIDFTHAAAAGALPRHHDDPFDRILIAQAQCEGLTLVTSDRAFPAYGVPLLAAS
ncbi:MAG: type II toxin-antitoxin system VapC family toxin [Egibacteraceae bacterium]